MERTSYQPWINFTLWDFATLSWLMTVCSDNLLSLKFAAVNSRGVFAYVVGLRVIIKVDAISFKRRVMALVRVMMNYRTFSRLSPIVLVVSSRYWHTTTQVLVHSVVLLGFGMRTMESSVSGLVLLVYDLPRDFMIPEINGVFIIDFIIIRQGGSMRLCYCGSLDFLNRCLWRHCVFSLAKSLKIQIHHRGGKLALYVHVDM